jgi:pimeloyl-ACP methyl ester carboxylesterase
MGADDRVSYVNANGIRIAYETFGAPTDPPVVLVTGLAVQMLAWPDELCADLAARGYYVVRADNRDIGLSTHIPAAGPLSTLGLLRRRPPYTIADMAADTAGLIKALGLRPVHLMGVSMGGFISQTVALNHPEVIGTLTLLMTSPGSPLVGLPRPEVAWRMLRGIPAVDRAAAIEAAIETFQRIGSPGYPFDDKLIRDIAGRSYDRDYDASGRRRQLAAVIAQPDRTKRLGEITAPTLVLHGLADPVIAPSGGLALARGIQGARFVGFSGMGHDLPRALWPTVVDELVAHFAQG